ncbi:hypothetical protein, partial [Halomonas daqiaonensis]
AVIPAVALAAVIPVVALVAVIPVEQAAVIPVATVAVEVLAVLVVMVAPVVIQALQAALEMVLEVGPTAGLVVELETTANTSWKSGRKRPGICRGACVGTPFSLGSILPVLPI